MGVRHSGVRQPSIWPRVVSDDAPALREWLIALGFREDLIIRGEHSNLIHHCQLDWPDGGRVLLSSTDERRTPARPGAHSLHVVSVDPDEVMQRALLIRATVVHPIADQTDYPSREVTLEDPDGNHWTFATFAG